MRWGRCLAALSAVVLVLSGAGCRGGLPGGDAAVLPPPAPTHADTRPHADVSLSDISYRRPDVSAIESRIHSLIVGIDAKTDAELLMEDYDALLGLYRDAESQTALAHLMYAFDVTDEYYRQEYAYLFTALNALDLSLSEASIRLFESSDAARALASERYGDGFIELVYADGTLNSLSVQDYFDREHALILQYDELAATCSISDGARDWTFDDIMADQTLTYAQFRRLYDAYAAALNSQAGEIFRQLVAVRNDIAKKLGYGNYAAYRYDCYGRDYSIIDARALQDAVKSEIVPVYTAAVKSELIDYDLYDVTFGQAGFFRELTAAADAFSPRLSESLGFMLRNGLYDVKPDERKMEGSFTTYLSAHRAPYIFSQWSGSYADINTIIHELGHFTNYYYSDAAGFCVGDSLDLAEVDSQALQLLLTPYYPAFFGELAESAETELMLDCMYALISGCMEDAFQQAVYADADMDLEQMNALYRNLAQEYGLMESYDYTGMEWVLIPHTFQSPMYYISYAVSMVPALELWERMQFDADAAREAYFNILNRARYASFRRVLAENGLQDAFAKETIGSIAGMLRRALLPGGRSRVEAYALREGA